MSRGRGGKPTGRKAIEEMEARLGELFGRLGETLGSIAGDETGGRDPDGQAPVRVHSDVRIRLGGLDAGLSSPGDVPAGPATVETPGEGGAGPSRSAPPTREPVFETDDRDGAWTLTAEMPGAEAESLDIRVTDGALVIDAGGARRYALHCPLPAHADPGGVGHRFANGILEVRVPWCNAPGGRS